MVDAALREATRQFLAREETLISPNVQSITALLVSLARRVSKGKRLLRDRQAAMILLPELTAKPDQPMFLPDVFTERRALMARFEAAAVRSRTAGSIAPANSAGTRGAEDLVRRMAGGADREVGDQA